MLREATAVIVKLLTRSGVGAGERVGEHASRSMDPRICSNRFGVKGVGALGDDAADAAA